MVLIKKDNEKCELEFELYFGLSNIEINLLLIDKKITTLSSYLFGYLVDSSVVMSPGAGDLQEYGF
jgi:hypothetical protein